MNTTKLLSFFLLFCGITGFAQPRFNQKREQIKSLKIAYITDELKLTSEEASKFWPVYNAYDEKQRNFKKERIRSFIDSDGSAEIGKMTEKEAAAMLIELENAEEDAFQNRKKFVASLKAILPATKILKLKKAEDNFNKKLLRQLREKSDRR